MALDATLSRLEVAEESLAHVGGSRRASGSYYTPGDVVAHFWQLFWRHHSISNRETALEFIKHAQFVEPSIGSGMFLFGMMRSLANFGIGPIELTNLKFQAVDINQSALDFVWSRLGELEAEFSVQFSRIAFECSDFLSWVKNRRFDWAVFIGNPPFVANEKGSRWKNLFADFLEAMLLSGKWSNISLILPLSICFSRDYRPLRSLIKHTGMPLSVSCYDNMPDCLFNAGKSESTNTNKANSQRCAIINLGGPRAGVLESSALLRWTAGARQDFLAKVPNFQDCSGFDISQQIPRPIDGRLIDYLREAEDGCSAQSLMCGKGSSPFAVGGVARNFIGIREYEYGVPGAIPVQAPGLDLALILLQIFASDIFYRYWCSFGDGFHVTNSLLCRFPVSKKMLRRCEENIDLAANIWRSRE
ncbi:MAG: hypothetical protein ACO2ER_08400, partial [Castellaniella sp.]